MRIAYIGLKGLPGTFSGIETHVHELGTRLGRRGHDVTAYVRPQYTPRYVRNDGPIQLLNLPTVASKHLDATVHSFLSAVHTVSREFDIVHFHTIGPSCFSPISRLGGAKVVTTIHRVDYLSEKWGWFARTCLKTAEQVSLRVPHATVVVAPFLQQHYQQKGHRVEHITNGVTLPAFGIGSNLIRELGLVPDGYFLFLGRLTPEKRPDWAVRAFQQINNTAGTRLVVAGGSSATDSYVRELRELAASCADKIIFTGPAYDTLKDELLANARAFVLPSALEGLPITLLEAMSHSLPCIASDIPPHLGIIRDGRNGFLHRSTALDHLRDCMEKLIHMDAKDRTALGQQARATVAQGYDWENVTDQIERLYYDVCGTTGTRETLPHRLSREKNRVVRI
jgi:glycosyltransferase involved in cell wall biosynthesis